MHDCSEKQLTLKVMARGGCQYFKEIGYSNIISRKLFSEHKRFFNICYVEQNKNTDLL